MESNRTVVYLGPPATHTHLACIQFFGSSSRMIPKESIQEIFEAVEENEVSFGVVPIENSTEGPVNRTLDMFIESEVKIYGEILIHISHALLSRTGSLQEIQKVYSHPQALEQCRRWLKTNVPQAICAETVSTAKAAQIATEDPNTAAIASAFAAQLYGLEAVASRIEDYPHNYTRFLVLSQKSRKRTGKDKTSILFLIAHTPGSLYRVLKPFSEKGINLTKIESRPIKNKPWEYLFFLDLEGHMTDSPIQDAMVEAKERLLFFKYLGSYPRGSGYPA